MGWLETVTVETVSDAKVETCLYLRDGIPARVSVRGSTSAQGSCQAAEEALARAGFRLIEGREPSLACWERGEGEDEEVCVLPSDWIEVAS